MKISPLQQSVISGVVAAVLLATTAAVTTLAITVIGSMPLAIGVGVLGTVVTGPVLIFAAWKMIKALIIHSTKKTVEALGSQIESNGDKNIDLDKTLKKLNRWFTVEQKDAALLKLVKQYTSSISFTGKRNCSTRITDLSNDSPYLIARANIKKCIKEMSVDKQAEARAVWIQGYANRIGDHKKDITQKDQQFDPSHAYPVIQEAIEQIEYLKIDQTEKDQLLLVLLNTQPVKGFVLKSSYLDSLKDDLSTSKTLNRYLCKISIESFPSRVKKSKKLIKLPMDTIQRLTAKSLFSSKEKDQYLLKIIEACMTVSFDIDNKTMGDVKNLVNKMTRDKLIEEAQFLLAFRNKFKELGHHFNELKKLEKNPKNIDRTKDYPELEVYKIVGQAVVLIDKIKGNQPLANRLCLQLLRSSPLKLYIHEGRIEGKNNINKVQKIVKKKLISFSDQMNSNTWMTAVKKVDFSTKTDRVLQILNWGGLHDKQAWLELQALVMAGNAENMRSTFFSQVIQFSLKRYQTEITNIINETDKFGLDDDFRKGLQDAFKPFNNIYDKLAKSQQLFDINEEVIEEVI